MTTYEAQIIEWVSLQMAGADPGHGLDHVQRVVTNATKLASAEGADLEVVVPAAWLHDCVVVAKNSPQRKMASRLAAEAATDFLVSIGFDQPKTKAIAHCIAAHSFSASIPCETIEAKVVQDADRLEAVGAIGIARCLMTGGAMNQRLYHPTAPIPVHREPKDSEQSIDHFFAKLLGLHHTMQTESGRQLAWERTQFMCTFLRQFCSEIALDPRILEDAIGKVIGPGS